jgi:hypothetical protein
MRVATLLVARRTPPPVHCSSTLEDVSLPPGAFVDTQRGGTYDSWLIVAVESACNRLLLEGQ